ncbi:hypothetical protein Lalb_Chr23g0275151 [Lupinus albus]|uniref:Uncharacterized protein n=1 Tax=Lupinus albus TaxID=3870 RepID=A0A6A4N5J6_LUPAL|nr:hypothetical protein Lalb_Chr23g0275151 [Lupinus albus]
MVRVFLLFAANLKHTLTLALAHGDRTPIVVKTETHTSTPKMKRQPNWMKDYN